MLRQCNRYLGKRRWITQNARASEHINECQVPVVSLADLKNDEKDLSGEIEQAFGSEGMGILAVSNVPDLESMRKKLLPLAFKFASFPNEIKNKYVLEDAFYSFGWSHGKEKLQGNPDYSKGSYYNNPQYNQPVENKGLISKYPEFIHPNIWPSELPELEDAFMNLGQCIVEGGRSIAKHCDRYVESKCTHYTPGKLHRIISTSRSCKGRLLHYFALTQEDLDKQSDAPDLETEFSNWCGWHNDHGSLTGLVQALYMDENGEIVENPDPGAGLYVKARDGEIIKAVIPSGHLIYQLGESAQIHSGGLLQATPHAVRGPKQTGMNRSTLAIFMEPDWDEPMQIPAGCNPNETGRTENLPIGVPSLHSRWNNTMDFFDFTKCTLAAYY